jgi:outer membrane protein OmpU
MDKFKKLGLTALAGSLACATAAQAGSVSGSWVLTYTGGDNDEQTGQAWGNKTGLGFSMDDVELDNGWTAGWAMGTGNAMAYSSMQLSIDMGDGGKLVYDDGCGTCYGSGTVDNVTPFVFEEADDGLNYGAKEIPAMGNAFYYVAPEIAGTSLTIGLAPSGGRVDDGGAGGAGEGNTDEASITLKNSALVDGLTMTAAMFEASGGDDTTQRTMTSTSGGGDVDAITGALSYAMGSFSLGYQMTEVAYQHGSNYMTDAWAVSYNVSDNVSIGYTNIETEEMKSGATHVTSEMEGIGITYTMGPMAIKYVRNEGDNVNGLTTASATRDDEHQELMVSITF